MIFCHDECRFCFCCLIGIILFLFTLRMLPFKKLNSSLAVALKSYFATASILLSSLHWPHCSSHSHPLSILFCSITLSSPLFYQFIYRHWPLCSSHSHAPLYLISVTPCFLSIYLHWPDCFYRHRSYCASHICLPYCYHSFPYVDLCLSIRASHCLFIASRHSFSLSTLVVFSFSLYLILLFLSLKTLPASLFLS